MSQAKGMHPIETLCGPGQVGQLVVVSPVHQRVAMLIPSQGTYLGYGSDPWSGHT